MKKFFSPPNAQAMARTELEESKRQLILAQDRADMAQAMVTYYEKRIARLQTVAGLSTKEF